MCSEIGGFWWANAVGVRNNLRMKRIALCAMLVSALPCSSANADCFDEAAAFHQVNPWVLRGIAYVESRFNPGAYRRNSNGTVDISIAQVNSVHFADLARYGIAPAALYDPCTAIYVAGWLLRKKVDRHGNTWKAVGAYHSETPKLRDAYAARVQRVVDGWIQTGTAQ